MDVDIQVIDDKFMLCSEQNTKKILNVGFSSDIFVEGLLHQKKCNFVNENVFISIQISLNFVPQGYG